MQPVQRASLALQRAMEKVSSARITYSRAGAQSSLICAVLARSTFVTDDEAAGAGIEASAQDFIVLVEDLTIANQLIEPQPGDIINMIDAGKTYEVMTPPFSPADSVNIRIRIHTKQVS